MTALPENPPDYFAPALTLEEFQALAEIRRHARNLGGLATFAHLIEVTTRQPGASKPYVGKHRKPEWPTSDTDEVA